MYGCCPEASARRLYLLYAADGNRFCARYSADASEIRAYSESGAKGNISRGISNMAGEPFAQLVSARESVEAIERYNGAENGRIRIDASLHAEYTNDEQTARGIAEVAKKHGVGMHVHVSETKAEHEECIERRGGRTPVKFLADCGLFDVPALAAHCVWIDDAGLKCIAVHARYLVKILFRRGYNLHRALNGQFALKRMYTCKSRQRRSLFIYLGVILHRA